MRHGSSHTRRADAAATAVLCLLSLAYFGTLAPYGLELADEGHLLHQIYRTYLGQTPYVDFHTGYSPGAYYLNAWLLHAFDSSLLAVRFALALVNSLCVVALFWLTRRLGTSRLAALLAGAGYVALVPFYDGRFAPFNIPYPAWYVTLAWFAAVICLVRWWESDRWWWLPLAGVCAGVVFGFKQNSGLLALATCLFSTVMLQRPVPGEGGRRRLLLELDRLERILIPLILALGFFGLFGGFRPGSQALALTGPLLAILAGIVVLSKAAPARPVPPGRLTLDLVVLGVGFAAATLPWLAYFWTRMGTAALLRDIFYIGTPYEQHYLIPYPRLGEWGIALTAGALLLAALPAVSRRAGVGVRAVLTAGALLALAGAALLVLRPPPMVEGFQASVVMRARDVSFAAVLVLLWAGVASYFTLARRRSRRSGIQLILLLSAVLVHMQIYPRSDFMHLVYAAPGALILGAWLLDVWARRFAASLGIQPQRRLLATALLQAPVWVLVFVLLAPALTRIDYLARAWWSGDPSALVRLDTRRAPLVIEPAAGRMFESLSATLRFLSAHTAPGDRIFTFPCLDLLTFLAEREDSSRHGYYYPGSPGHAVEAEVIDALQASPPRYVVTLHDHALFFMGAPVYYFNLRQHITSEFALDRRLGLIDALAPLRAAAEASPEVDGKSDLEGFTALWLAELRHDRGAAAASVATAIERAAPQSIEALADLLLTLPTRQQRLLALLIQKSRSAAGAAALAKLVATPELPQREFQLFIRIISGTADLRAVPYLLAGIDAVPFDRQPGIAGNLFTIASKSWIESYFYAPGPTDLPPEIDALLPTGKLINWMQDPWENPALRSFALRMAGNSKDPALVPFLMRLAGDAGELGGLRLDAVHSLVAMGYGTYALPVLANLFPTDFIATSALLITIHSEAPQATLELIGRYLVNPAGAVRAQAFWVAAAAPAPELLPLLRQGLNDPEPEVRMAAAWALGRLGGDEARAALAGAAGDGHEEVAVFVARALRRLALRPDDVDDAAVNSGARPVPPPAASNPPAHPS